MPVHRTSRSRRGITEVSGSVTVTPSDRNPDGSWRLTAEEHAALRRMVDNIGRAPKSFAELTAGLAAFCRRTIEQHGGRVYTGGPVGDGETCCSVGDGAYVCPGAVEAGSPIAYAVECLWYLSRAQHATRAQDRLINAFYAGDHARDAAMKFRWEDDALLGEKRRAQVRAFSARGAAELAARRDRTFAAAVSAYRRQYPHHSDRATARNLHAAFGITLDAARKRIGRLPALPVEATKKSRTAPLARP